MNSSIIKKYIYNEINCIFLKSNIPTLDILFKRLLVIDPENRMTFNEFFDYVLSPDFMKEGVIYVNNNLNYKNIYMNILQEIQNCKDNKEKIYKKEGCTLDPTNLVKKAVNFVKNISDVMNFPFEKLSPEQKFNNILYYNENKEFMGSIYQEIDYFERHTSGAFIFCNNEISLSLVIKEILKAINNDQFIKFNIMTTGSSFEKIMKILDNNPQFKNCISNVCIYCLPKNKDRNESFKSKYKILCGVYDNGKEIVKEFIEKLSSKEIKPFPIIKLITYDNYFDKYKERHHKISQFYGDISRVAYEKYFHQIKSINEMHDYGKELNNALTFDLDKDIDKFDELILKKYADTELYKPLNAMLYSSYFYEATAYITAKIMHSLNNYAMNKQKYCNENQKILFRGLTLPYTLLMQYERVKGKVICLPNFTSTSENEKTAIIFAKRYMVEEEYENNLNFSVIYRIINVYQNGFISNGVNIQELSKYEEKEYLFQPFSFFYLNDIHIDFNKKTADILLETVGKKEILEEKIKGGKEIKYSRLKKVMEIK